MALIKPPKPRHKLNDLEDKLIFTIPNPSHPFTIFGSFIWLSLFTFLLIALIVSKVWPGSINFQDTGMENPIVEALCLIPYFGFWLGIPWCAFLWQVTGKEIIEVNANTLRLHKSFAGLVRTKEYFADEALDLRVAPPEINPRLKRRLPRLVRYGFYKITGKAAFTHQGKEIRFAEFVDEAEASQIIETFQKRFPQYDVQPKLVEPIAEALSTRLTDLTDSSAIRIVIPARKTWRTLLASTYFLVGTLVALGILGFLAIRVLPGFIPSLRDLVFTPGTVIGTLIGVIYGSLFVLVLGANLLFFLIQFLWPYIGREMVEISDKALSLKYQVSLYKWGRSFSAGEIKKFRVSPLDGISLYVAPASPSGSIAFDYGAETFYCGNDADEAEARQIVAIIHQRFPQYH